MDSSFHQGEMTIKVAGDMDRYSSTAGVWISPNIFVGVFAVFFAFLAYIISSTSLGKRSISHAWLFTGLIILNPSEKSLRQLDTATYQSTKATTTAARRNNNKIQDVSGLHLTCKSIRPGSIPLSFMTDKDRVRFLQWQALDAAVYIWLACLIATAGPFIVAWYTVYQEETICCGDLKCWLRWWREQLGGPGLIVMNSPPPNLMLFSIASVAIWFWWRLVMHSTRLPERSIFRFSPFSYINGWLTFLATLILLRWSHDTTTKDNTAFLGIPLNGALEEWSARVTFWIGLTGYYLSSNQTSRELVMHNMYQAAQLLFAATTGLIAFALADPLRVTMRVYFGNVLGDKIRVVDTSGDKYYRLMEIMQEKLLLVAIGCLPVLCFISYFSTDVSLGGFSRYTVRAALGWSFVLSLASAMRPLLWSHLLRVLPEINLLFRVAKHPTSEVILSPFQKRSKSLLSIGGQLLIFPAFVLLLLTLGHSAGKQPVAVSDANTITTGIYPFAFHRSLWTEDEKQKYQEWEEFQAKTSAQNHLDDKSIFADLSTTRANIELCPNGTSFAFLRSPGREASVNGRSTKTIDGYSVPIYKISKLSQLISSKLSTETTFIRVLRKLQQLARNSRDEIGAVSSRHSRDDLKKEAKEAQQSLQSLLQALAFHPQLTSTVLLPVLDFIGLLLNYLWLIYFAYFGIEAWTRRRHRRQYDLYVKGEDCRVVLVEPS